MASYAFVANERSGPACAGSAHEESNSRLDDGGNGVAHATHSNRDDAKRESSRREISGTSARGTVEAGRGNGEDGGNGIKQRNGAAETSRERCATGPAMRATAGFAGRRSRASATPSVRLCCSVPPCKNRFLRTLLRQDGSSNQNLSVSPMVPRQNCSATLFNCSGANWILSKVRT